MQDALNAIAPIYEDKNTDSEDSHSPIVYPISVLQDSANPEAARELEDFLFTPETQSIFEEYGFMPVDS